QTGEQLQVIVNTAFAPIPIGGVRQGGEQQQRVDSPDPRVQSTRLLRPEGRCHRHGHDERFFFSSRRRHTRSKRDWSSDVCSSDLYWPLRSPTSASKRFPGNAERSLSDVAASIRSSFRRAGRSNPENALTRFPAANSLEIGRAHV